MNEHLSALGAGSVGRDAYRDRLPAFLADFDGLSYDVVSTISEGDDVAVRYRMTAVYHGHPIDIDGVMLIAVRAGLVASRTDVWDGVTFLDQTGDRGMA